MKKNYWLVISAVVVAAFTTYFIVKKQSKNESTSFIRTLINAGVPDQVDELETDQLENAKMVSEGSQFGVQYFNQAIEEFSEELENRIQH